MKKILLISVSFVIFSVSAAVYNVGTKSNPASVRVTPGEDRLQITCTFKAQTKFSASRNAFFNRVKADRLCRQGILLHCKAKPGQKVDLSGITIEKNPVRSGGMITYFFSKLDNVRMASVPAASKKKFSTETTGELEPVVCRQKDSITVFRYQTENGSMKILDTKKYTMKTFKSRKEFDDFCERQFRIIDELAEINRQKVLEKFERSKNAVIKKMEK